MNSERNKIVAAPSTWTTNSRQTPVMWSCTWWAGRTSRLAPRFRPQISRPKSWRCFAVFAGSSRSSALLQGLSHGRDAESTSRTRSHGRVDHRGLPNASKCLPLLAADRAGHVARAVIRPSPGRRSTASSRSCRRTGSCGSRSGATPTARVAPKYTSLSGRWPLRAWLASPGVGEARPCVKASLPPSPWTPTKTSEGRANNRRAEFAKL